MTEAIDYGMPVHPVANFFPVMEGKSYEDFKEDIRQHGLIDPVIIHEGQIVDGRNRSRACNEVGQPIRYREWREAYQGTETLAEWIFSQNVHRRHLTTDQITMLFVQRDSWELKQQAQQRKQEGRPPAHLVTKRSQDNSERAPAVRTILARKAGVSERKMQEALYVNARDPELAKQVARGEVKLYTAGAAVAKKKPTNPFGNANFTATTVRGKIVQTKTPAKKADPLLRDRELQQCLADAAQIRNHLGNKEKSSQLFKHLTLADRILANLKMYERIGNLVAEVESRRKAFNDHREKAMWNPTAVHPVHQREVLNLCVDELRAILNNQANAVYRSHSTTAPDSAQKEVNHDHTEISGAHSPDAGTGETVQ